MQVECICGFSDYNSILDRQIYEITSLGETVKSNQKIELGKCINCGIVRQVNVPFMNNDDYFNFYKNQYEPNNPLYIVKTYKHDRQLAKIRCDNYGIVSISNLINTKESENQGWYRVKRGGRIRIGTKIFKSGERVNVSEKRMERFTDRIEFFTPSIKSTVGIQELIAEKMERILDVGSGSGAFVDECRELGHEAYGCEISNYSYAKNSDYIYYNQFENINFPTDHFDKITAHDVIEHSLTPKKLFYEIFRMLKQGGLFIIDFP